MNYFANVKNNFGFGCMRLPLKDEKVDYDVFKEMIDYFLNEGFNYFDTAHMYVNGLSESALRECLVKRYPRDKYIFTNKLSTSYFSKEEEIIPLFESQLKECGLDYFDFYLMHSQDKEIFEKYKRCHAYEMALMLKKQGKIKHFGISFHDNAKVLDEILTEYPQIEVVQIQFNYLDFNDEAIQSKRCYEVCRKHNKPVIVMEPVKGGSLVNLPSDAKKILEDLHGGSTASYAIRFAAGFEGIFMVLSGMSNLEQMKDNLSYMKDFKPLNDKEKEAIENVCKVFYSLNIISCTACGYCLDGCPKHIPIPNLFACMNANIIHQDWNSSSYYNIYTKNGAKASTCIKCGKCEHICPQHLPIRKLLEDVSKKFDN